MPPSRWILLFCLLAGCGRSLQIRPEERALRLPPSAEVERGTLLSAQLRHPLSTTESRPGDRFTAELLDPLLDGRGETVVPAGALVEGVVTEARGSAFAGANLQLRLDLLGLRMPERGLIPAQLSVADPGAELASPWATGLLGAVAGAAAGAGAGLIVDHRAATAVAGGAIVGLGVGALAGWLFSPREALIPAGSVMTFRLDTPLNTAALSETDGSYEPLSEGEARRTRDLPAE